MIFINGRALRFGGKTNLGQKVLETAIRTHQEVLILDLEVTRAQVEALHRRILDQGSRPIPPPSAHPTPF
jgi:hypothetical protein